MNKKYLKTKTTIFYINYNFVFRTRCNRKIFKDETVRRFFEEQLKVVCGELDIYVTNINIYDYYVHLRIQASPRYSVNDIISKIKSYTSKTIRKEIKSLSKLPSLWTREYIVTTEDVLEENLIKKFLWNEEVTENDLF